MSCSFMSCIHLKGINVDKTAPMSMPEPAICAEQNWHHIAPLCQGSPQRSELFQVSGSPKLPAASARGWRPWLGEATTSIANRSPLLVSKHVFNSAHELYNARVGTARPLRLNKRCHAVECAASCSGRALQAHHVCDLDQPIAINGHLNAKACAVSCCCAVYAMPRFGYILSSQLEAMQHR